MIVSSPPTVALGEAVWIDAVDAASSMDAR
jgi:hypothetical protein